MERPHTFESRLARRNRLQKHSSEKRLQKVQRQLYYLWDFIGQEGLWNEAKEYVEESLKKKCSVVP